MELDTKEIVHVATVDKRQTNWNSNVMEKEGFIQTVEKLTKEIKVVEFCTDAHVQIGALLSKWLTDKMHTNIKTLTETPGNKIIPYFTDPDKGRYKELRIHHSLDVWHGAKNLSKKIAAVSSNTPNFIHNSILYQHVCQLNYVRSPYKIYMHGITCIICVLFMPSRQES